MHKAVYWTSVVLMVVFSSVAFGQESPEMAIRGRIKQYETAYNAGDADAMAAIYAVDASHTYALGFTHHGRDEIVKGLKDQFAGPFKGTHMTITALHIRPLSSDVAVEEGAFVLAGLKDNNGTEVPPFNGLCLVVYKKQGDQWFIEAVQCLVPPPAPASK